MMRALTRLGVPFRLAAAIAQGVYRFRRRLWTARHPSRSVAIPWAPPGPLRVAEGGE